MSNKYFTKGKRTQRAVRAVSRAGEKVLHVVARSNNALEDATKHVAQIAERAIHNPRTKINRTIRRTRNAILDSPMLRHRAEAITNRRIDKENTKNVRQTFNPIIEALEFDKSVLKATDFLERHKIISPRQATKVRIAQQETTYARPKKYMGVIQPIDKQKEQIRSKDDYISRLMQRGYQPIPEEKKLMRLIGEISSRPQKMLLDNQTRRKIQQTLDDLSDTSPLYKQIMAVNRGMSKSRAIKLANEMQKHDYDYSPAYQRHERDSMKLWRTAHARKDKVQRAYSTLGENYYHFRNAALKTKRAVPKVALGLAAAKAIEMLMDKQNKEKP